MPPAPSHGLDATPRIARLLASLQRRLRLLILVRGLGTVLAVAAGWLAFMFLADYGLRVPAPVRVLHVAILFALVGWFLWRDLLRPLHSLPREEGLALFFERRHPELRELLISAVQFQRGSHGLGAGSRALVERVLVQADARAAELTPGEVTDSSEARLRALIGAAASALVLAFLLWQPALVRIFLNHAALGETPWPRRTHLVLELPGLDASAHLTRSGSTLHVLLARGSDLAIAIRAEGVIPETVTLHADARRDLDLQRSSGASFRTVLRSLEGPITLWATGGDDPIGTERLEIEVLQPPDVGGLAMVVTPPRYTGLAQETLFDQDIEVPVGSHVRVHVLALAREGSGDAERGSGIVHASARLLPSDESVELVAAGYPSTDPSPPPGLATTDAPGPSGTTPEGSAESFAFALTVTESTSFRIELEDGMGLENPDPGLHWIRVRADRAPELSLLAPARSDFSLVQGGAVPMRLRIRDDYGIDEAHWTVSLTSNTAEPVAVADGTFELHPLASEDSPAPGTPSAGASAPRLALATRLLEVSELGSEERPVDVDQRYLFEFSATDRNEPDPGTGKANPVRARVVAPEELLRRMQERLARARLDALKLSDLQREKRDRVEELIGALDSDDSPHAGAESVSLAAALSGQRRVLGDSEAVVRALARAAEEILYARLDASAGDLLERYDSLVATRAEIAFRGEPWKRLGEEMAAGTLPSTGFASNLCRLVGMGLDISEGPAAGAARELDQAERALDPTERLDALVRASELQTASLKALDALLDELAEWDNFQNVLSLTRDLLNRQRALRERTQKFAAEK